ncbi:MAG TPA: hypothetical protein VHG08_07935 [Longimicrobium sp.]|nr:hypothetical protein [Longimicrobium sp.]
MTTTPTTPSLDEIRRAGLEALRRELGPVGMVRFLQQFENGSGDYTAERAELLGNPGVAEIVEALAELRESQAKQDESA